MQYLIHITHAPPVTISPPRSMPLYFLSKYITLYYEYDKSPPL
jgi:hypothetical protein